MEIKKFNETFFNDGYVAVEGAIGPDLLAELKDCALECLARINKRATDLTEGLAEASERYRLSDIQVYMHSEMQHRGLRKKLLLQPQILDRLIQLVGPDMAYCRDGQVAINARGEKDNLYIKKWHQEMWSGAGLNEVWIWTPVFIDPEGRTGMEFVPQSHHWGMIPNRNREPSEWPADYKINAPALKEGTAVFFHTLTLHRTIPNTFDAPRIAFISGVRNFAQAYTNNEEFRGWTPFHLSPYAKIRKILGNTQLTPFRTYGQPITNRNDGKEDLPQLEEFR